MPAIGPGRVKTTWKYGTGKSSARRSASHCLAAAAWHFGQCRLPQVMGVTHYLSYGERLVMGSWRRRRQGRAEIRRACAPHYELPIEKRSAELSVEIPSAESGRSAASTVWIFPPASPQGGRPSMLWRAERT